MMTNDGGTLTAPGQQGERSVDDLRLAISIQENLTSLPPLSPEMCIFRVPEKLRCGYEEAYTPRVVSIGPYHRRSPSVRQMEDQKLRYLESFLERNQECCLEDYIEKIRSWEVRARGCYDEQIDLSPDEFAKMMLLDGIFMIQLFQMDQNPEWSRDSDRIFGKPGMFNDVRRDMMLLENQMPFFAIEGLFEMAFGSQQRRLLKLSYWFFRPGEDVPESLMESKVKHFLDIMRLSYLPLERSEPYDVQEEVKLIPSATELVTAGVKLRGVKPRRGDFKLLFDIEFKDGVLEIPHLKLYHATESYFRNIIAFEQCYCQGDSYLIEYFVFMDHLVNTPRDSKLLIDKGIIENWLGNEEAATDLFNSFCKDISLRKRNAHFHSLRNRLVAYCRRPYNIWRTTLRRDYCSNPWVVLSTISVGTLLILTLAQTVLSLLSLIIGALQRS